MTNLGLRIERPYIVNALAGSPGHCLALSLGCWEQKDITKLIALKLDPLTLSEQRQHGSERLCHSGWDTDGARCEDRLVSIDLFASPAAQEWPYVVISREAIRNRKDPPHYGPKFYTHLWIQLYEEPRTILGEVVGTYPRNVWNSETLTIDLAQLRTEHRLNDSEGRPITVPNQVSYIALRDHLGNAIAIHFVQVDQYHHHAYWSETVDSKCYFAVTDYDSQIHQKLEVSYLIAHGSTHGSCQLPLQGGYMVNVKLRDAKQPGVFIAQLLVTTERIDPPLIVEPPYELEACVPKNQGPAKIKMNAELLTETEEEAVETSLACRLSEVPDVSEWRKGTVQDLSNRYDRSNYRFWIRHHHNDATD